MLPTIGMIASFFSTLAQKKRSKGKKATDKELEELEAREALAQMMV